MEADLVRPSSPEDRGRARSRPAGLRPRRAHQSSSLRAQPLLARVKVEPQEPIPMTKDYRREEKRSKEPWYGLDKTPTSCSDSSSDGEQVSINNNNYSPISKFSEECACCAWCQKAGPANEFSLKTPGGSKVFCSEQCFTQCRRASFKRNKTCDWCRHVRHTVNYVDFQDGDHQLQFCSDKCLNQYKMNIFCKETEAHLEAHPHLRESGGGEAGPGLITPELWLRDCRSPASDGSLSPLPAPLCLDTKKKIEEPLRKEHKKKSRSRTRRVTSPPRVPIHPFPLPPPPVLHPPWRRKPDMPPLLPIARPVPMLPGLLPPPTTLVPYPIIIPIPIPIPIPLPLPGLKMSDLEAAKTPAPESEKGSSLPQPPPRKRKRLSDIQPQDVEAPRKPKIVPA